MSNPIEHLRGLIVGVSETGCLTIRANYDNWNMLMKRGYKEVWIDLIDGRPLSDKQRRMCWAMLTEIGEYQGQGREITHEERKLDFQINELGANYHKLFSLSDAPMSLVAAYQNYLIRFIIDNDIPTKRPLLEYTDDIGSYVYYCLIAKKCCVCGRPAELHHIDAVGMGRDRDEIIHEGMEAMSLCREHHAQCHTMGNKAFFDRYHFDGGIELDKTLCRIYKIKSRKDESHAG